jgi:cyclase
MRRTLGRLALVVIALVGVGAIALYRKVETLDVERVTDDVHVIFGLGGNVGVLATQRGAVIVDTMTFRSQGAGIREIAEKIGGGPVQALINTHYHRDHTHGNPAFPPGTRIVSTQRTRELLESFDGASWTGAAAGTLPNETFSGASHEIAIGGKTVRALYLGRGHTSGDMAVLFVEDRVLHLGDLFFSNRYPSVDLEAGGSVREWIGTLDRALALDGYDRVIPGHGPVSDREGVRRFRAFLAEVWDQAQAAAREHRSLADTLRTVRLTKDVGYQVISIPLVVRLDRDYIVRRAWEEATGAVKPRGPAAQPVGAEQGASQ